MRRAHLSRTTAVALCLAALTACGLTACGGSDGPTGPSATFSPVGSWAFNITDAKSGDATCGISGYTVTFTESGGTLGGSIATGSGTTITCVINGQSSSIVSTGTASLTSASRNGSSINFGYTTTNGPATITGTIQNDNRMSGTASIRLSISGSASTFSGKWSATRK